MRNRSTHMTLKEKGVDYPEIEVDKIWMQVLESYDIYSARRFAVEFEFLVNPVYPMPHAKSMLDACSEHSIQMGIISNAQFFTPMLFDIFFKSSGELIFSIKLNVL
jgi:putative hydrolase of the HAD superfamily